MVAATDMSEAMATESNGVDSDDDMVTKSVPATQLYSHCDSYYVNRTRLTYWSVYDGLTDTLLVNVLFFVVRSTSLLPPLLAHVPDSFQKVMCVILHWSVGGYSSPFLRP